MTITATAADNAKGLDYFKENKVFFLFFFLDKAMGLDHFQENKGLFLKHLTQKGAVLLQEQRSCP